MLLLDKAWIGSQDTVYMSVGCVCVVFVLDVVWFKNVNMSEPLQKEDVTAMTSSSRRERLGDFKSHSYYVTLPSYRVFLCHSRLSYVFSDLPDKFE